MNDTQGTRGHYEARRAASLLAGLRKTPPAGLEDIADLSWDRIESISWNDATDPTVTVVTMDERSQTAVRTLRSVAIDETHPQRADLEEAMAALVAMAPGTRISVRTMVAYPGWTVTAEPVEGQDPETAPHGWQAAESLAVESSEWDDFIVQRDADENAGGEYAANTLLRAAAAAERRAADLQGYHRHWNRVDAELLRRMARTSAS